MSSLSMPSRVESVLGQALGSEFRYYLDVYRDGDSTMLFKLGGAAVGKSMGDITDTMLTLLELGITPAAVHGGGPQIDKNLRANGITPNKAPDGIRITDGPTVEVVRDSLLEVNTDLTATLTDSGISAQPITEGVFKADFKDEEAYGFVGDVVNVDDEQVRQALSLGMVPVISCLGESLDGQPLNINGDEAASALAVKLITRRFIMLTNAGGVRDDKGNVISVITAEGHRSAQVDELIKSGVINEGMLPKIHAGLDAVAQLPPESSAAITKPSAVIRELFTHAGEGTLIRRSNVVHHKSLNALKEAELRRLIEDAFNARLSSDYFENLPPSTEVFITAQQYKGAAIVIPGEAPDDPAYLDKIIVPLSSQGDGFGRELMNDVMRRYPDGLFWRTGVKNDIVGWYSKLSDTQNKNEKWAVFTSKVAPEKRADCIQRAFDLPPTIEYDD